MEVDVRHRPLHFTVMKINSMGRRQQRVLSLRGGEWLNIRPINRTSASNALAPGDSASSSSSLMALCRAAYNASESDISPLSCAPCDVTTLTQNLVGCEVSKSFSFEEVSGVTVIPAIDTSGTDASAMDGNDFPILVIGLRRSHDFSFSSPLAHLIAGILRRRIAAHGIRTAIASGLSNDANAPTKTGPKRLPVSGGQTVAYRNRSSSAAIDLGHSALTELGVSCPELTASLSSADRVACIVESLLSDPSTFAEGRARASWMAGELPRLVSESLRAATAAVAAQSAPPKKAPLGTTPIAATVAGGVGESKAGAPAARQSGPPSPERAASAGSARNAMSLRFGAPRPKSAGSGSDAQPTGPSRRPPLSRPVSAPSPVEVELTVLSGGSDSAGGSVRLDSPAAISAGQPRGSTPALLAMAGCDELSDNLPSLRLDSTSEGLSVTHAASLNATSLSPAQDPATPDWSGAVPKPPGLLRRLKSSLGFGEGSKSVTPTAAGGFALGGGGNSISSSAVTAGSTSTSTSTSALSTPSSSTSTLSVDMSELAVRPSAPAGDLSPVGLPLSTSGSMQNMASNDHRAFGPSKRGRFDSDMDDDDDDEFPAPSPISIAARALASSSMLASLRRLLTGLHDYILLKRAPLLREAHAGYAPDGTPLQSVQGDALNLDDLSIVVWDALQRCFLFHPALTSALAKLGAAALSSAALASANSDLVRRLGVVRGWSPAQCGLEVHMCEPASRWDPVAAALASCEADLRGALDDESTVLMQPCDRLALLLRTGEAIVAAAGGGTQGILLTADDLIGILVLAAARARLRAPLRLLSELTCASALSPDFPGAAVTPTSLLLPQGRYSPVAGLAGRAGYLITALEAAFEVISKA